MDDMESKLGAILGDPEMMQKIMTFAQTLGQQAEPVREKTEPDKAASAPPFPDLDPGLLQKLASLTRSSIDKNQQQLLRALGPYLSRGRITKLERAMRAARMAGVATTVLGNHQTGR